MIKTLAFLVTLSVVMAPALALPPGWNCLSDGQCGPTGGCLYTIGAPMYSNGIVNCEYTRQAYPVVPVAGPGYMDTHGVYHRNPMVSGCDRNNMATHCKK